MWRRIAAVPDCNLINGSPLVMYDYPHRQTGSRELLLTCAVNKPCQCFSFRVMLQGQTLPVM